MIRKGTRPKKLPVVAGLMAALAGILLMSSACSNVSAQEIKGILQAMDGKEVTITLDDGSTVRVSVSPAQASSETQSLVGQPVTAEVRTDSSGRRHLVSLRQEDHGTFIGVLQSIAADKIVVEGKTFKTASSTALEQGLATGMTVRVKFTTQADGSNLAVEVESKHPDQGVRAGRDEDSDREDADQDADEFTGVVTAVSTVSITVGDRTFKLTSGTEKEGNIVAGATVEVEFVTLLADGSLVAEEIDVTKPAPTATPTPTLTPTTVSYSSSIQPIFNQYCTSCHGAAAVAGVNLSNYASTMASNKIVAGNAASSKVYTTLTGSGAPQMPPSGPIPAASIQAMADWINQGALNNYM